MPDPSLRAEVERFFRERLPVLPGFEDRPQQRQMAEAVARAFEDEEILVAEAGTGTGKSLAYLVPALLWRARGGREPVVVATRTLNLQQQILDVDVPRLQGPLGLQFRAVQARGWSNYLCLRRLHGLPRTGDLTPGEATQVQAVADHLARGGAGLRSEVPVGDELWSRLACDSTACGRQRCPFYGRCLLFRERQALEGADLVVTNHALLLSDLALRRDGASGILPGLTRVILDEAHHLEEAATDHLGYSFMRSDFHRFLQQLYRPKATTEEGGFLAGLRLTLAGAPLVSEQRIDLLARVDRGLLAPLPALAGAAEEFLHILAERIPRDLEKVSMDQAWFATTEGEETRQAGLRLGARLADAVGALREIAQGLDEAPEWETGQSLKMETQGFAQRLESMRSEVEFCLYPESPDWVYWAESSARDIGLGAAPLDVGPQLSSLLFGRSEERPDLGNPDRPRQHHLPGGADRPGTAPGPRRTPGGGEPLRLRPPGPGGCGPGAARPGGPGLLPGRGRPRGRPGGRPGRPHLPSGHLLEDAARPGGPADPAPGRAGDCGPVPGPGGPFGPAQPVPQRRALPAAGNRFLLGGRRRPG